PFGLAANPPTAVHRSQGADVCDASLLLPFASGATLPLIVVSVESRTRAVASGEEPCGAGGVLSLVPQLDRAIVAAIAEAIRIRFIAGSTQYRDPQSLCSHQLHATLDRVVRR